MDFIKTTRIEGKLVDVKAKTKLGGGEGVEDQDVVTVHEPCATPFTHSKPHLSTAPKVTAESTK